MTDTLTRNALIHVGLHASTSDWTTVAASLISADVEGFDPKAGFERLRSPSMAGDGKQAVSRKGKSIAQIPAFKIPLRGCKSGGAGDSVASGAGANNELVDILLEALLGQAASGATGETTDGVDAGSGTTVNASAATSFAAGDGILVQGTSSGKLNAREVVSAASAAITVDRALDNDGTADTADEGVDIYAMDTYSLAWATAAHKHLTFKVTEETGDTKTWIGCLPSSAELDFPLSGDATLTLNGFDFTDFKTTEAAGTYSAPTVGEEVVCIDSPVFIGSQEYLSHGIKVAIANGAKPRVASGTPRGVAGMVCADKKTVTVTAKILVGTLSRNATESLKATLETTTQDVSFQHGRDAGGVCYCRFATADTISVDIGDENGQRVMTWQFLAHDFNLHLG